VTCITVGTVTQITSPRSTAAAACWRRSAGSGIELDRRGVVFTGHDCGAGRTLETSQHGVFAIGDVRSGSVKGVAACGGRGAEVMARLHAFLASRERASLPVAAQ